jgi:hypothetical protein
MKKLNCAVIGCGRIGCGFDDNHDHKKEIKLSLSNNHFKMDSK